MLQAKTLKCEKKSKERTVMYASNCVIFAYRAKKDCGPLQTPFPLYPWVLLQPGPHQCVGVGHLKGQAGGTVAQSSLAKPATSKHNTMLWSK